MSETQWATAWQIAAPAGQRGSPFLVGALVILLAVDALDWVDTAAVLLAGAPTSDLFLRYFALKIFVLAAQQHCTREDAHAPPVLLRKKACVCIAPLKARKYMFLCDNKPKTHPDLIFRRIALAHCCALSSL